MSWLWRLLTQRAGHQDLPSDLGPDPEPDEPEPAAPVPALAPQLTDDDFARAAAALDVPAAVIRAVAEVESAGRGFLPSGRTTILWEAHVFHRQTGGRYADARDSRGRALSSPHWDQTLYGPAGEWQWDGRLLAAAALPGAEEAAQRSASYGLFQVLGTNAAAIAEAAGHPGWVQIQDFVSAMNAGAGPHLDAFVGFVKVNRLAGYLRNRRWQDFARRYNGPAFAQNAYDKKLVAAYRKWSRV